MKTGVRIAVIGASAFLLGAVLTVFLLSTFKSADAGAASVSEETAIAPADFVIGPCTGTRKDATCFILAAGGKRILFNAPAGIGRGVLPGDDTLPDAVLMFSLHPRALEGLDEVRNRVWAAGRQKPLTVSGGEGIEPFVAGMNKAFVTSDAIAYLEGEKRGGFDVEALQARTFNTGDVVFNTGDLKITALPGGPARTAFLIDYLGRTALIAQCGVPPLDIGSWPDVDVFVGCLSNDEAIKASKAHILPLRKRIDLRQN